VEGGVSTICYDQLYFGSALPDVRASWFAPFCAETKHATAFETTDLRHALFRIRGFPMFNVLVIKKQLGNVNDLTCVQFQMCDGSIDC